MITNLRKQVYDLKPADFEKNPAWEFALDEESKAGQDESTVRPLNVSEYDPDEHLGVVKAKFKLHDGTELMGYLTPDNEDPHLRAIQPTIVTDHGQVPFWFGMSKMRPAEIIDFYDLLKKKPHQVFPLSYESDFAVAGGAVKGEIKGFCYLDENSNVITVK